MTQNSRDSLIEELASLMLADEETSQSAAGAVGEVASREQPSSAGLLPIPRGGPLRPSRVQERIWLQEREAPGLWNIGRTLAVYGRLNESALQTALDGLLARHEPLRTRFAVEASGALLQVIDAASRAAMDVREAREPEIHELVKRHQEQLFDLEKGPLFRILLLRLAPEEHVVSLALHHSICDGWSLAVLAQDLRELYQAAVQDRSAHLPPLRIQYADYAAWQRSENTTRSLAFWKMTLDDPPSPLKLSSAPAAANSGEAVRIVRPVPQALAKALFRYAREQRASLFMILLAGWALAAYRRTRQEDFCLSTTVAGRDRLELEPLIGSFVNVLPLRMRIAKDATGREIVEQARQVALSGLEHQSVSFEQILDEVPGLRQAGRATPLPLVLRHQNLQAIEISAWSTGLQLRELTAGEQRMATTDLDVQYLGDERSGLSVAAVYNVERLDRDAVEAVLDDAELMLQRLEETPDVPVSELLQLTQDEQEEQRAALCGVERPRATWNVTARFAEQVRLRPGALACQDTEQSLTYRELDRRSEIVARALCEQGAGPHQRVVLFLRRSVDFVAALLGVWKARSVYVPLDPAYPADFAKSIIASVDASVLISGTGLPPDLAGTKSTVLTLQTLWAEFLHTEANFEPAQAGPEPKPEDLAYIASTSGSTNTPKLVAVAHGQLTNCLDNLRLLLPFGPDAHLSEVVAQKTGINFVVHLKEMLAGLLVGVPQWIAPDAVVRDTPVFARAIAKHGITRLNLVPSHLDGLLEHAENLRGLRYVVTAGEALPEALRARFARLLPSTELFNNYGSTEMNDITYFHAAGPSAPSQHESIGDTVPIGKPIQNLRLHIFDDDGHPLPFGVAGELYVEGAAVGPKGYWGRPELTGERWVRNRAGALLFRTGDVVRLDRQSSRSQDHALDLRYMGRSDFQVKLRGQKVDPLQVEQALRTHPQLEEAAVQGWYSGQPQALLAAYYTVRSENVAPDRNELHRWLAGRLPFYMVPSAFIRLQAMPRLENGKLDRRGLPEPELETKTAGAHCPPETLQEQEMAAAWAEVLQIPLDSIGRDDNFFAIGGNSLLAVQLVERLKPAMPGIDVQLVFETPVLRKLSARTHEAPKEAVERHSFAHVLPLRASGTGTPLFCIHPIFGFGWAYAGMLSTLESSRPVYVIQAMGLSPEEELPRSFEEMIGDYIRKIRCLQPHGPYQLCGWSFGGIVAQAIAAQLQAEQEEVQFLCILDASPFGEGHRSSFDPNLNLRRVLEIFAAQSLSSFGLDSSAINAEMIDRVVRIVFNSADNLSKYKLKTYQGDALFVRATLKSSEVFGQFFSTHAAEQWSRYIAGKVECVDVESTHLALLEGANGIAVGKLIENRLVALEAAAKA